MVTIWGQRVLNRSRLHIFSFAPISGQIWYAISARWLAIPYYHICGSYEIRDRIEDSILLSRILVVYLGALEFCAGFKFGVLEEFLSRRLEKSLNKNPRGGNGCKLLYTLSPDSVYVLFNSFDQDKPVSYRELVLECPPSPPKGACGVAPCWTR